MCDIYLCGICIWGVCVCFMCVCVVYGYVVCVCMCVCYVCAYDVYELKKREPSLEMVHLVLGAVYTLP